MSKVFRLHKVKGGGTGWFSSTRITRDQLNEIKTDGKEIATSIPSPFARIDLVNSAFRWVAENGVDGSTSNHKLVSDALDVAQLFYSVKRYNDLVKIVSWNPHEEFENLINGNDKQHNEFAETLKLFWQQDSSENDGRGTLYNFEKVNRLFFIINKHNNHVIGSTSPSTLFMAAPDVNKVTNTLKIVIGSDKLFDDEFMPLHKRERSFVKYMYVLSKQSDFSKYFPEVFKYLEEVRNKHIASDVLLREITQISSPEIDSYSVCPVLNNNDDPCEILGIKLGIQNDTLKEITNQSDFVIRSDYDNNQSKPLILPHSEFSKDWRYTTDGIKWNSQINVPYINNESPENSILPQQSDRYFWLSIGNFLQDRIIKLPYDIDDTKFITCESNKYLLPLTNTFYKYFQAEKSSKYLHIKELAGGAVRVQLEIPVKAGNIMFKKIYSPAENNIIEIDIHVAILPFIKSKRTKIKYTFGLINDKMENNGTNLSLTCFNNGDELELSASVVRDHGEKTNLYSQYYKFDKQFDSIKFIDRDNNTEGFIIPRFREYAGDENLKFAIDFGTTNTHIEYKVGNSTAKVLNSDDSSPFLQSLLKWVNVEPIIEGEDKAFEKEMIPFKFSNEGDKTCYPTRTALVYNKNIDYKQQMELFCHINNYLFMENISLAESHLKLVTQLKWSNYSEENKQKQVESYIEYMLTLVYYKTLILGGNLQKLKIIWFYPVSMSESELGTLEKCWQIAFRKVFYDLDPNRMLVVVPESVAPYLYYKSSVYGESLSIDIGGGSSDIAIFDENDILPKLISSFKFAGNAIFGDGYPKADSRNNTDRNGFVKKFKKAAKEALENTTDEKGILDDILNNRKDSADFSSLLFSLESNEAIQFNYSRLINKDKNLKVTLLVFYAAIAYYTANLLKKSAIKIPKHILISGTASKTSSILDPTENLKHLSDLYTFIFEKVYQKQVKQKLKFRISDIPKEITCKGAIKADINDTIRGIPIKFWIGGSADDQWSSAITKDDSRLKTPKYSEIKGNGTELIISSLKDFYCILDEFVEQYDLDAKFLMNQKAYNVTFKDLRDEGLENYLIRGIKAVHKEDDENIGESLFFYPLIGILNELTFRLSDEEK